jgi:hypothetical protein
MRTETTVYKLPVWACCPIEYDDYSGITDMETHAIHDFLDGLQADLKGHICFNWGNEEYFSHSNDLPEHTGLIGGNVINVQATTFYEA